MPPEFQEWYGDPPGRLQKQFTRGYNDPAFGRRKLFNRFIMDVKGPGYSTNVLVLQAMELDRGLCDTSAFRMAGQEARLFQNEKCGVIHLRTEWTRDKNHKGSCIIVITFTTDLPRKRNLRRTLCELISQKQLWLQESSAVESVIESVIETHIETDIETAIKTVRRTGPDSFRRSSAFRPAKEYTGISELLDCVSYGTDSKQYGWLVRREYERTFPSPRKPLTPVFFESFIYRKKNSWTFPFPEKPLTRRFFESIVYRKKNSWTFPEKPLTAGFLDCSIYGKETTFVLKSKLWKTDNSTRLKESTGTISQESNNEHDTFGELKPVNFKSNKIRELEKGKVAAISCHFKENDDRIGELKADSFPSSVGELEKDKAARSGDFGENDGPRQHFLNGDDNNYRGCSVSFHLPSKNFFVVLLALSIFATPVHALPLDAMSYPVCESNVCSRKFFETRPCPFDSADIIKHCDFDRECGEGFEPKCIPNGSGSLFIGVQKNQTCPPGHMLSVHLPKNQPDIVTGSIVSCPDGQYKLSPSDCFEACTPHADIRDIPAGFSVIVPGTSSSTTKVACDETNGYYNTDGRCSVDYDLNLARERSYYLDFCTHVSDPLISNPCRKEAEKSAGGVMCVPKCAEDKETKPDGTNCTCIHTNTASNDTNTSRSSPEAVLLTTASENPLPAKTTHFPKTETRGDGGSDDTVKFAVIGVFFLLILIAIIIAMCCFWRRRPRRMENVNQPNHNIQTEIIEMENGGIPNGHTPNQIENGNIPNGHTSIPNGVTKISQRTKYTGQNVFQIRDITNFNLHFHKGWSTSSMENGQGMEELEDSSSIPFIDSGAGQEEHAEAGTKPFEGAVPETQLFEDVEAGTQPFEGAVPETQPFEDVEAETQSFEMIRRDPEGESADQTYRKQFYTTEAGPSTDESEVDENMVLLETSIDSSEEREQTKRKLLYED